MTTAALVRCDRAGRTYGTGANAVVALNEASCEIAPGQQIALMGQSGSGKSTLLHLVAGLDEPTAGTVDWPALGAKSLLRPGLIGIVFQAPSLLPPLDVTENIALPLLLCGTSESTARAAAVEAMELLGLHTLARKLPEELSGGQAQRVAIARVLATRPRLILADEPTGQLDFETATHVIDVLLHAAAITGAALLLNTHDPLIAERLASQWEMRDGRLSTDRARNDLVRASSVPTPQLKTTPTLKTTLTRKTEESPCS